MPKGSSPKKGSPKKDKSSKSGSPKKKSPKGKRSPELELPQIVVKNVKRKLVQTTDDLPETKFKEFQCPQCKIIIGNFTQFLAHCCWRKFYQARFHLGETQAFACRNCRQVYYSHGDYATHKCITHKLCYETAYHEVEEVLPIEYSDHFNFYINWARRVDWETKPHQPVWDFKVRCSKCGNMFRRNIDYLLHSCYQFSLLKPAIARRLKICSHCKCVFINTKQYDIHLSYCNKAKSDCNPFHLATLEIVCQQFVLGRHCYEFDYHLHSGGCQGQRRLGEPIGFPPRDPSPLPASPAVAVGCSDCGFIQPNLFEYLNHPCTAGRLITPADLELTLCCNLCKCFSIGIEDLTSHIKSCLNMVFTFVRFNTPELLRLALKRWTIDVNANPYLPARQEKFMCSMCKEIFRVFICFLQHPCPKRERYERLFIQPSALLETYVCHACNLVIFSASASVSHSSNCSADQNVRMWQVHYTLNEALEALKPWTRGPQLIQLDFSIGIGDPEDEEAMRKEEKRLANNQPSIDWINRFYGSRSASSRLENFLSRKLGHSYSSVHVPSAPKESSIKRKTLHLGQTIMTNNADLLGYGLGVHVKSSKPQTLSKKVGLPMLRRPVLPCQRSNSLSHTAST